MKARQSSSSQTRWDGASPRAIEQKMHSLMSFLWSESRGAGSLTRIQFRFSQGISPAPASGMSAATRMMGMPVWVFLCISTMARGRCSKA